MTAAEIAGRTAASSWPFWPPVDCVRVSKRASPTGWTVIRFVYDAEVIRRRVETMRVNRALAARDTPKEPSCP